jgi:hypothetical protein
MKKIFCFLFFVFCCLLLSEAQTMVLEVDRSQDLIPAKRGPNLKTFGCLFLGGGLVASGDQAGARIKYGSSGEYFVGGRAKYKISGLYSLGWEFQAHFQYYKLQQTAGKILPDTNQHNVERFDIGSIGLSFYNRFNFDPHRGNYLGNFLDLGITGEWMYSFIHVTKDKAPDNTDIKISQTNLPYINNLASDVFVRVGFNKISIYARYRISDFFKTQYGYPELPKLIAGVEFAIFRD